MLFDFEYFIAAVPRLLRTIHLTIELSVLSMVLSVALGLVLESMIRSRSAAISGAARFYVLFFRSTPLLVQLFLLYYGLPQLLPGLAVITAFQATVIGLSLNNASYLAEIFRAAINSVDRGQIEAALSVGMSRGQGLRRILLPQAFRTALPAMGNTYTVIIKETSLAFTLGLTEMMGEAKLMAADTLRFLECFLAVSLLYFVVAFVFGKLQRLVENRLNRPYATET
ncbi:amino acid ABC transporter permease [Paenibacillus filicis]|uniref:Amino acid ABC transporter permease n=1 Tax=Paenibacillus filicis TaxID=669464 RepID=A0ABU9DCX3_9BACL